MIPITKAVPFGGRFFKETPMYTVLPFSLKVLVHEVMQDFQISSSSCLERC